MFVICVKVFHLSKKEHETINELLMFYVEITKTKTVPRN